MTKRSKTVRRGYALFPCARDYSVVTKRTPAYSHPIAVVDMSPDALDRLIMESTRKRYENQGYVWDQFSYDAKEGMYRQTRLFLECALGRFPKGMKVPLSYPL